MHVTTSNLYVKDKYVKEFVRDMCSNAFTSALHQPGKNPLRDAREIPWRSVHSFTLRMLFAPEHLQNPGLPVKSDKKL